MVVVVVVVVLQLPPPPLLLLPLVEISGAVPPSPQGERPMLRGKGWILQRLSHGAHPLPVLTKCMQAFADWRAPVVSAGVPIRIPLGDNNDVSPATVFLLTETLTSSNTFSILEPVRPRGRKSHRIKWLSVPPGAAVSHGIAWFHTQPILTTCQIRYHSLCGIIVALDSSEP